MQLFRAFPSRPFKLLVQILSTYLYHGWQKLYCRPSKVSSTFFHKEDKANPNNKPSRVLPRGFTPPPASEACPVRVAGAPGRRRVKVSSRRLCPTSYTGTTPISLPLRKANAPSTISGKSYLGS